MFYGCRNPWVDFKYKFRFIIFSTQLLTVLIARAITLLVIGNNSYVSNQFSEN